MLDAPRTNLLLLLLLPPTTNDTYCIAIQTGLFYLSHLKDAFKLI